MMQIQIPSILLAVLLTVIIPGLVWHIWFSTDEEDLIERISEVIGLSIATVSILALLSFLIDVRVSGNILFIFYGLFTLLIFVGCFRRRDKFQLTVFGVFGGLFILSVVLWRLFQARGLVFPLWVDSPHHALIVRKILEIKGIPEDLSPYLPIPFNYHFGFHVLTALFSQISDLPIESAMLILGQILNAGICFSSYRLAKVIWNDKTRAIFTALIIAFFSQMPAYYLSWGRYTLLTGLVLLPIAISTIVTAFRGDTRVWTVIKIGLFTAGLFLSHYFLAFLLLITLLILLMNAKFIDPPKANFSKSVGKKALVGFLIGILVVAPWLPRIWHFSEEDVQFTSFMTTYVMRDNHLIDYFDYLWELAGPNRGYILLALTILDFPIMMQRTRLAIPILANIIILLLIIVLIFFLTPFRPDHFVILAFMPLTQLASDFLISAHSYFTRMKPAKWLPQITLLLIASAISIWGSVETHKIINPHTIIAIESDRDALQWIEENTSIDARFLINSVKWQGDSYRSVDSGGWILPITGRSTSLPPITYSFGDQDLLTEINRIAEKVNGFVVCSNSFWQDISDWGINYIYLTRGHGTIQPKDLSYCLDPVIGDHYLKIVYARGDVTIYQVKLDR